MNIHIYMIAYRANYARPVVYGDYTKGEDLLEAIRDAIEDKADVVQVRVMRWQGETRPAKGTRRMSDEQPQA